MSEDKKTDSDQDQRPVTDTAAAKADGAPPVAATTDAATSDAATTDAATMDQVRSLIVGAEQSELATINERVSQLEALLDGKLSTNDLPAGFAAAISGSSAAFDRKDKRHFLSNLNLLTREGVKAEIRAAEPAILQSVSANLTTVITQTIKQQFDDLIDYINEQINGSSSPLKRVQIKLRSIASRRPEAEIWLEAFPQYSVTRAMLVHQPSGLLIRSVHRQRDERGAVLRGGKLVSDASGDDEIIASMLSAIGNFADDAFGSNSSGGLKSLEFESSELVMFTSPLIKLVAVIEGPRPRNLEARLNRAFARLTDKYAERLKDFDGQITEDLKSQLRRDLEAVLRASDISGGGGEGEGNNPELDPATAYLEPENNSRGVIGAALLAIFVCLLIYVGYLLYQGWRENRIEMRAMAAIEENQRFATLPLSVDFDRTANALKLEGLIAQPGQRQELSDLVSAAIPSAIDVRSNLSTIWEESIAAELSNLNQKITTNSDVLSRVVENQNILTSRLNQQEDQQIIQAQTIAVNRSSRPTMPHFAVDATLIDLRRQVTEFLTAEGSVAFIEFDRLALFDQERLAVGLSMLFNEDGEFKDSNRAFRVGEVLSELERRKAGGRRLNVVAVVSGRSDVQQLGQAMLTKAQSVLKANHIDLQRVELRLMVYRDQDMSVGVEDADFGDFGAMADFPFVGFSWQ